MGKKSRNTENGNTEINNTGNSGQTSSDHNNSDKEIWGEPEKDLSELTGEKKDPDAAPGEDGPNTKKTQNVSRGAKIAIIALAVAVAFLLAIIISDKLGKKDDDGDRSASASTEALTEAKDTQTPDTEDMKDTETEAESEEKTEEKTEADSEKQTESAKADGETVKKPAISAAAKVSAEWESGNNYVVQYSVDVKNATEKDVKKWEVRIPGYKDSKMDNSWGAEFKLDGDTLLATPVDYTSTVASKASVNYGYQVIFKSKSDAGKVKLDQAKVYIDGNEVTETVEVPVAAKVEKKHAREPENGTPLEVHGALSVKGTDLVDQSGKPYQLRGVSTHGLAWFPQYVNKEAFQTFRDDWGANLIRLAMYTGEGGGYCTDGDQEELKALVDKGVDYATELGMYVIIDWHILSDNNPKQNQDEAIAFFNEMAQKYADYKNVLFEICNEPNGGTSWSDIKEYAEAVIPVIRKYAKDAVIIVGTPTWSQDVDAAAKDPITGEKNLMYTLHFYAATHKDNLRDKLKTARDAGLPIFISEFSICDASGNGGIDYDSADAWFQLIEDCNLSYAGWNVSNKDESSALIRPDCEKTSGWTDDELSETGLWLKNTMK